MKLNDADYRVGAELRLLDAQLLYEQEHWVGATYMAGRAVEAILRSILWIRDRQQEIGHDLRGLLRRVRSLGMLTESDDERLEDRINDVAVVWHNNLRFLPAPMYSPAT